jgi:hypothetical protein
VRVAVAVGLKRWPGGQILATVLVFSSCNAVNKCVECRRGFQIEVEQRKMVVGDVCVGPPPLVCTGQRGSKSGDQRGRGVRVQN